MAGGGEGGLLLFVFELGFQKGAGVLKLGQSGVKPGFFCLICFKVDFAGNIPLVQLPLAVQQHSGLFAEFVHLDRQGVYGVGDVFRAADDGIHLRFQCNKDSVLQVVNRHFEAVAWEIIYRLGVGAVIITVLVGAPGHGVAAAPAEYLSSEGVIMTLPVWQLKTGNGLLDLLKGAPVHDGGVEVRDGEPLVPVPHPAGFPAYLRHLPLAHDVGAGVPFVLQYSQDG